MRRKMIHQLEGRYYAEKFNVWTNFRKWNKILSFSSICYSRDFFLPFQIRSRRIFWCCPVCRSTSSLKAFCVHWKQYILRWHYISNTYEIFCTVWDMSQTLVLIISNPLIYLQIYLSLKALSIIGDAPSRTYPNIYFFFIRTVADYDGV